MAGGASSVTAGMAARDALMAAAVNAINDPSVWINIGHPGVRIPNDVVSFRRVNVEQTGGATNQRARWEDAEISVTVSCFRHGGYDMEQTVADRAVALLQAIEYYCRRTDPTLGGVCQWCFLDSWEGDSSLIVDKGRTWEIEAIFKAKIHIVG